MLLFLFFVLIIVLILFANAIFFPLPLSDTGNVRHNTLPWVTLLLIIVSSLVFMLFQAPNYYQSIFAESEAQAKRMLYDYVQQLYSFGYRDLVVQERVGIGAFVAITSMFMHADMWHLIYNMIYLWTFGRRVEDACGHGRFLLFYLLSGLVANIGSDLLNRSNADLPGIGASGAIAGVMGAYLIMFPGAMVLCFWGIGIVLRLPAIIVLKLVSKSPSISEAPVWRWTIKLPAFTYLIFWLIMNTMPSLEDMVQGKEGGGTDTLAHLTGFLAAIVIFLYMRKDVLRRYVAGRAL